MQKKNNRKKKKKGFTIPWDVALLVVFGTLIFVLFMLTNKTCQDSENDLEIPELSINIDKKLMQ